jgi:hypothetical protein
MNKPFFLYIFGAVYVALLMFSLGFDDPRFRPWEYLYDESTNRFEPSQSITMTAVGDLGRETWIRDLQIEKRVTFTTDEWGLRNQHAVVRPEIIVLGDSYIVGSGATDDETLTARMSQMLGTSVYNFGIQSVDSPGLFLKDRRFAANPPRVVIWAPVSRRIRPRPLFFHPESEDEASLIEQAVATFLDAGEALGLSKDRANRDNGLSTRARYIYNDALYRIRGHENLIHPDGPGGAPALALDVEAQGLHVPPVEREVDQTIAMVSTLSNFLTQHRVHFIYSPIPESATIYPELFRDRAEIVTPSFLDELIAGLQAAGVVTLDLRPVFAAHRQPYLYLRDDSHWTPAAVEIAAEALSEVVASLEARPAPPIAAP